LSYFSQNKGERDMKNAEGGAAETKPDNSAQERKPSQDIVSTFGPGLLVTGNIICTGSVQISGRVVGDIHAARLLISKGAEVEGTVMAQEAVIDGEFKGVIHSNNVKLQATAVVEGEIFKQSLVIEQNAQFEGVARRLATTVEAPTADQIKGQKPATIAPAVAKPQSYVTNGAANGNAASDAGH